MIFRITILFIVLFSLSAGCGGGGAGSSGLVIKNPITEKQFPCYRVDFNDDGIVGMIEDLDGLKTRFCSEAGDEIYEERYDINNDGIIDHYELGFFKCCYNKDADQTVDLGSCIEEVEKASKCTD